MRTPCGSPTVEGVQGDAEDNDVEQGVKGPSTIGRSDAVELVVLLEEEETVEGEEAAVVHDNMGVQLGSDAAQEGDEHTGRESRCHDGVQVCGGGGVYVEELSATPEV